MKFQHTARLNERTVTEVSKGKKVTPKRGRKVSPKNGKVHQVKVHEGVWREATRLAGGDLKRITVVNPEEVIVR